MKAIRAGGGEIAELKGPKSTRLFLQMEAAHSQLTVYRSTASVPGQHITVGFNRARSQPVPGGGAEYICLLDWLFRGEEWQRGNYTAQQEDEREKRKKGIRMQGAMMKE